jgi:hypothetical protein
VSRQEILDQAAAIVTMDRNVDYGEPEANFERIAALWSAYLESDLLPHDVAVLMILLKVARIAKTPGIQDHWIDIAGYSACGGEVSH